MFFLHFGEKNQFLKSILLNCYDDYLEIVSTICNMKSNKKIWHVVCNKWLENIKCYLFVTFFFLFFICQRRHHAAANLACGIIYQCSPISVSFHFVPRFRRTVLSSVLRASVHAWELIWLFFLSTFLLRSFSPLWISRYFHFISCKLKSCRSVGRKSCCTDTRESCFPYKMC